MTIGHLKSRIFGVVELQLEKIQRNSESTFEKRKKEDGLMIPWNTVYKNCNLRNISDISEKSIQNIFLLYRSY